jgi:hypothetical protein
MTEKEGMRESRNDSPLGHSCSSCRAWYIEDAQEMWDRGLACWHTPVIPVSHEVKAGGSQSKANPRQECETLSKNNLCKKGWGSQVLVAHVCNPSNLGG